jgi:hypothetical protein
MLKILWNEKRLPLWVAAGLAFFGGLELVRGFTALFAPVSNDYSEMMVAGMAEQLRLTGKLEYIYAPPAAPYQMPGVQYPPLFIALTTLLMILTGVGPVLASRLLAWGGYALAGMLVGLLVQRETGDKRLAFCSAFFPFTFWSVLIFINGARPDPLALLLSLFAVYLYRSRPHFALANSLPVSEIQDTYSGKRVGQGNPTPTKFYPNQKIGRELEEEVAQGNPAPTKFYRFFGRVRISRARLLRLALVAFVLVLAFYSKQTYLAAAAAIFFHLLLTRGRRGQAFFFGALYGLLGIIGFILCQVLSNNSFAGIFDPARAGRFIFHLAPAMVGYFVLDHAPLIILALVVLVWQWRRGQRFWPIYLFFATLACASIVKDGAVDYYFNEVAYLLAVQVGIGLFLLQQARLKRSLVALTGVQVVIAAGMFLAWNQWKDNDNFGAIYREAGQIMREYQQSGRPALVWQNNFLIDTGHTELIGDYFIYWILLGNNHRDMTPLLNDLQNQRYEMILVGSPEFRRWPPVLEQAVDRNYNLRILSGQDGRPLYWLYTRH